MWRLTKPKMKAEGGRRKTNKQTLEQRGSLWSLVSLSVTLYPSNHAFTRTVLDTIPSSHTHTQTHTEYMYFSPHTLLLHFETLKMWLSKGSVPESLLQPSSRIDGLIVKRVAATTKGIKSLANWQTYMVRLGSKHLYCLVNSGLRLPRV